MSNERKWRLRKQREGTDLFGDEAHVSAETFWAQGAVFGNSVIGGSLVVAQSI
jgi:hypothetical protein